MADTGFLIGSAHRARVATMYNRKEDGSLEATPFAMPQRPEFFMGGGALFSTPRDYIAFLQMLLNNGSFNGAQLLKPETAALEDLVVQASALLTKEYRATTVELDEQRDQHERGQREDEER